MRRWRKRLYDPATWRELAALLKKVRWDKEAVERLGLEPLRLGRKPLQARARVPEARAGGLPQHDVTQRDDQPAVLARTGLTVLATNHRGGSSSSARWRRATPSTPAP